MTSQPLHFNLISLAIVALLVWRIYKRVRRLVGRQRLHPVRPWFTVVLFPLLSILVALGARASPDGQMTLLGLAGGAVLGIGLGVYGYKLTRFEITPVGRFYTPSAHLGVGLSLLFVARIAYRIVQVTLAGGQFNPSDPSFARSPLTLAVFGLLAGYYVTYAIGLLRWKHASEDAAVAAVAAASTSESAPPAH